VNLTDWQADQFEEQRSYLRAVALRILGSPADADDAVQETWLRLSRSDTEAVANMRGWLTTVVSRICLDMLRARSARREQFVDGWLPEPVLPLASDGQDPERDALVADSVAVALLVVLETLTPAERLAFVLHDMFGVPFGEIAPIVGRDVAATRQLASRARRRVRTADEPHGGADLPREREVVEAFLSASREGDFEALIAVLDPAVVFRADAGASGPPVPTEVRGATAVAKLVLARGTPSAPMGRAAIIDGRPGAVVALADRVQAVVAFTIVDGRITAMDLVVDPEKLDEIRL
jgi:RNA polymerase sigma-70 factor (ECF subfamily)